MPSTQKSTTIKAAVAKALAPSAKREKALSVQKRRKKSQMPNDDKENKAMDLNAALLLSEFCNDPNIKNELVTPTDGKAELENSTDIEALSNDDLLTIRNQSKPYRRTANRTSRHAPEKPSKSDRSDSAKIMHYDIDLKNDSDLVILIKREINRMQITPNDIYELIGSPECPFLRQKNDGWNLIYSLRTRGHITYENAIKWSVILNKQLVTFVVDETDYERFMGMVKTNFPNLLSDH